MRTTKRVIAFAATILMALSLLSCFVFAAPAYLPEGYVVVNPEWTDKAPSEHFPFVLGGDTYELEFGSTAVTSIEEAGNLPLAPGKIRTVVLAPGTYSSNMNITSNMRLFGPYFGKNPNNNPKAPDYDPSLPDWALNNGRSLDETKEAVITSTVTILSDCTDLVMDGFAITGTGQIRDSTRADTSTIVNYTLRNLYIKDGSAASAILMNSGRTKLMRNIYLENCRIDSPKSGTSRYIDYRAETFQMTGSFFGNATAQHQFYAYALAQGAVAKNNDTCANIFINNRFQSIPGVGIINYAMRDSVNAGSSARSQLQLIVKDNDFINCSPTGSTSCWMIRPQVNVENVQFVVTGNKFILEPGINSNSSSTTIYPYNDASSVAGFTKLDISKNYFSGYPIPISAPVRAQLKNIGPNYFADTNGNPISVTPANSYVSFTDGVVYDSSCRYSSDDFNILNSNIGSVSFTGSGTERNATLYFVKTGAPVFKFKGEEVTASVYSDSECTVPVADDFVPTAGEKIYVKATEGPYSCTYTVTLSSTASSLKALYRYGNANVCGNISTNLNLYIDAEDSTTGYYDLPADDEIEVATGASYAVYDDVACTGNPMARVKLNDGITNAYLKVTAPNGSSDVWKMTIYGNAATIMDDELSSDCRVFKLMVDKAGVSMDGRTFTVTAPSGASVIYPKVNVSNKATYKFYLDKNCAYEAATTATVKLEAATNVFYIRVTAEDGTQSAPYKVIVHSARKAVSYADAAKIPSYAKKAIEQLNKSGNVIFSGDSNNNLNPTKNITRYELAKVIVSLAGINVQMAKAVNISDVFDDFGKIQSDAPWAIPYIRAAYASGMIEGVQDTAGNLNFNGNSTTTREQFVTVIVRFLADRENTTVSRLYKNNAAAIDAAYKKANFKDKKSISSWALQSVKIGNYYKLVSGDGTNFNPKQLITRAEVGVVAYNATK